jgi:hypothetical protein
MSRAVQINAAEARPVRWGHGDPWTGGAEAAVARAHGEGAA